MPEKYNGIKGVIVDIDDVLRHAIGDFSELEEHENNKPNTFLQFDKILYPPGLDKSFWTFTKVIDRIGNFLYSLFSYKLSVAILSHGNIHFLSVLLGFWSNINKSDLALLFCTENLLEHYNQNMMSIISSMNIPISNLMIIGDVSFYFDLESINSALRLGFMHSKYDTNSKYDFISKNFTDVLDVIKKNIFFDTGKLPNSFLNELLSKYKFVDHSVIIGPSVGEDNAAVDITKDEVLLIKSDPITFAANSIGHYSVLVNSNDIATSGAMPKWMLTTMMFPPNTSAYEIQEVFSELHETCSDFGISICGGHTEITDAVSRPIIAATVLGTIKRKNLIDKKKVKTGDLVLMTKGIAIEGTVIIASEFKELLLDKGMSEHEINNCLELKQKISILDEAKIAWKNPGVSALHDITEGGISTAITELSKTSGYNIDVYTDSIFIYQQTQHLCNLLNINALGLIGSGSLLICCNGKKVESLIKAMDENNIPVRIIGKVSKKGNTLKAYDRNRKAYKMPLFEVDEMARIYKLI